MSNPPKLIIYIQPWETFFRGKVSVINRGGESRDFCVMGWALARQVLPHLQVGAEIVHQTPDTKGSHSFTGIGGGVRYDLSDKHHLLAYIGPGLQNAAETAQYSWYVSMLFTF